MRIFSSRGFSFSAGSGRILRARYSHFRLAPDQGGVGGTDHPGGNSLETAGGALDFLVCRSILPEHSIRRALAS